MIKTSHNQFAPNSLSQPYAVLDDETRIESRFRRRSKGTCFCRVTCAAVFASPFLSTIYVPLIRNHGLRKPSHLTCITTFPSPSFVIPHRTLHPATFPCVDEDTCSSNSKSSERSCRERLDPSPPRLVRHRNFRYALECASS
jgi:hypothetical protein